MHGAFRSEAGGEFYVLLPARHDGSDSLIHCHLCQHLDHRRPPRRILARCAGRAGSALDYRSGKILGGAAIAWVQALFFLVLALTGQFESVDNLVPLVAVLAVADSSVMRPWECFSPGQWNRLKVSMQLLNLVFMPLWW